MSRPSRTAAFLVVAFGVFVAADDLTVVATTLRDIIGDLDIPLPEGFDDAAWIVNGYLVAYVAAMPLLGRLADIVGRRLVFVSALGLFAAGSLWLPHVTSLGPFVVGRVLTAIGGAAMIPVALATTADLFEGRSRTRALGLLGALDVLGWVWGPLFGALIVRFLDWRWQFHVNVPLALLGMLAGWWALREHAAPRRTTSSLDLVGAATLTVGLVALTVALLDVADISVAEELADLAGEGRLPTVPLLLLSLVAFVWFVRRERRHADPLVDLRSLRDVSYSGALVVTALMGGALVIAMVDVPLFVNLVLETEIERAAVRAGLVLSSLTVAMAIGTGLGGVLAARIGHGQVVAAGAALAALGFALMGAAWSPSVTTLTMAIHLTIVGLGLGSITAPLHDVAVGAVTADRRGSAAGVVVLARVLGLTVGLAGLTAWAMYRYDVLRSAVVLPPLTDPAYEEAALAAQASISADALGSTFAAAAIIALVSAVIAGLTLRRMRFDP